MRYSAFGSMPCPGTGMIINPASTYGVSHTSSGADSGFSEGGGGHILTRIMVGVAT